MSKDTKSYVALVRSSKSINLDEILDDMVDEGTGLSRPQALAYFEKLTQLVIKYLGKGYFVNTPLFRYRSSIPGKFDSKTDFYDPTRHEVRITSSTGARIKGMHNTHHPEKVIVSPINPQIDYFIDANSDERNTIGYSGGSAKILGSRMRFDKTDPRQGIFFVSDTVPAVEYRASQYSGIRPAEIHVTIPQLEPGDYKVKIRTLADNKRDILTGSLEETILF